MAKFLAISVCLVMFCALTMAQTYSCTAGNCDGPVRVYFGGVSCHGNVTGFNELHFLGDGTPNTCRDDHYPFPRQSSWNCSSEEHITWIYGNENPTCAGPATTIDRDIINQCVADYGNQRSYVVVCDENDVNLSEISHSQGIDTSAPTVFPYATQSGPCSASSCSAVTTTLFTGPECTGSTITLPVTTSAVVPHTCFNTGSSAPSQGLEYANWQLTFDQGPLPHNDSTYFTFHFYAGGGCLQTPYASNSIACGSCLAMEDNQSQRFNCNPDYVPTPTSDAKRLTRWSSFALLSLFIFASLFF